MYPGIEPSYSFRQEIIFYGWSSFDAKTAVTGIFPKWVSSFTNNWLNLIFPEQWGFLSHQQRHYLDFPRPAGSPTIIIIIIIIIIKLLIQAQENQSRISAATQVPVFLRSRGLQ